MHREIASVTLPCFGLQLLLPSSFTSAWGRFYSPINTGDAAGRRLRHIVLFDGLHKVHKELDRRQLSWNRWYLDDGFLRGSLGSLRQAVGILQSAGESIGLNVRLNKCTLWSPSPTIPDDVCVGIPRRLATRCDGTRHARWKFSIYFPIRAAVRHRA